MPFTGHADGTSVRDIVTKARVNQAAINYHFKSKDGLYLEVLKTAFEKLTTDAGFDPENAQIAFSRGGSCEASYASNCGRYYFVTI